jgi:predicted RNA binding protein YcfA (HicA-like mRNA interferase family)
MSGYPDHVWKQLKNISADELVQALEKDGFIFEGRRSSVLGY